MKKSTFGWMSAAAIALFALSAPAFATVQTIDLGKVLVGSTPTGTAPWLEAQFTFTPGDTTGTLTLTSMLTGSEKVQGAGVTGWGFNVNDSVTGFSFVSGTEASTVLTSTFTPTSNGVGSYNLGFDWKSPALMDNDTVSYTLTFADALGTTSPFVANDNGFISYAHVQGIPNTDGGGTCSGFIVDGSVPAGTTNGETCGSPGTVSVPEPEALGLFGLGVLLIGGFLGLRRRWN